MPEEERSCENLKGDVVVIDKDCRDAHLETAMTACCAAPLSSNADPERVSENAECSKSSLVMYTLLGTAYRNNSPF